jgi:hypothetical protein
MKAAFLRAFGLCTALALGVRVAAQDSEAAAASPRTPTTSRTAIATTPTPIQGPEAPPPDAGLMKPSPTPRGSSALAPHPLSAADCADGAWQNHVSPKFSTRQDCEGWVREYIAPEETREFHFPYHNHNGSGASLRSALTLLI